MDGTGFFTDDSQSIWSNLQDGPEVVLGGARGERLSSRNLYASLGTGNVVTRLAAQGGATNLNDMATAILGADSTGVILGLDTPLTGSVTDILDITTPEEQTFTNIINWTIGEDIDNEVNNPVTNSNEFFGESVHTTPGVITYGTSETDIKDVVFLATNQGTLHAHYGQGEGEPGGAVGTFGGRERWTYIPDVSLLKNLGAYYKKELNGSIDHVYGLDGEMTFRVERNPTTNAVDKAHIYLTQRRGGDMIFAVDVTRADQATNPVSKLWTIDGGTGNFSRLGQTWSKPILTEYRSCASGSCTNVDALVFSGGYDTDYDDSTRSIASLDDDASGQDTLGNAVYIVNADTGALLWTSSNSSARVRNGTNDVVIASMDHSIPAQPLVLDTDQDGAVDIIFVIDLSGQIFRYDFVSKPGTESVTGGRIANLQESGVNRRFYNPLDAVLLPATEDGAPIRIALTTGSGYRAHPLEAEGFPNRLYVVYDPNDNEAPPDGSTAGVPEYQYVESGGSRDIIEVSDGDLTQLTTTTTLAPGTTHKYGYFVNLNNTTSEKLLNRALITDSRLVTTSYSPSIAGNSNACSSAAGTSTVYIQNLNTGEIDTQELQKPGISAPPALLYLIVDVNDALGNKVGERLKPIVIIGTEILDERDGGGNRFCDLNPDHPKCIKDPELGKATKKAWWEMDRGN